MKSICKSVLLASAFYVAGCTELTELNNKVGDWAGQINQTIYGTNSSSTTTVNQNDVHSNEGSFTSRQNIDKIFIKVRREFGFRPTTPDSDSGKVYHTVPGTLYHVSGRFERGEVSQGRWLGDNYLEVIIEKTDNRTVSISWKASGSAVWVKQAESRLINAVKN